ncbi:hypothetical protein D3C87_1229370 [compost metagenome]
MVGFGRRTITGLLTTSGQQFVDWAASYRLFSKARFDSEGLFAVSRRAVAVELAENQPLVAVMDDTLIRKRGHKIAGTSWRRDPLGPHFCDNFIWAQRFLQIVAALPEKPGPSRARAIPIDMRHCPSPHKPRKKAPESEWAQYRQLSEASRISVKGQQQIAHLRACLDEDGQGTRQLVLSVDGSFTNSAMLRHMPERTTLVGRIRKDAKLYYPPEFSEGRGRRRYYGDSAPTPEQVRQDDSIPWDTTQAFLSGQLIEIEYKAISPVRWRASGPMDLLLVIVRPRAYRLAKGRPLNYRDPIYLLCSDTGMSLSQLIQAYLWRWEVEVGFRDQKTLLGSGEAQVRSVEAVERVPALIAAVYGFLHLAVARTAKEMDLTSVLPRPRWYPHAPEQRISTQQAINLLRAELWGRALEFENKTDFVKTLAMRTKSSKFPPHLASAILYAQR